LSATSSDACGCRLPFRIDYINTIKTAPNVRYKKVLVIDTEWALLAKERITQIAGYICETLTRRPNAAPATAWAASGWRVSISGVFAHQSHPRFGPVRNRMPGGVAGVDAYQGHALCRFS
jgi:hypothetical protein